MGDAPPDADGIGHPACPPFPAGGAGRQRCATPVHAAIARSNSLSRGRATMPRDPRKSSSMRGQFFAEPALSDFGVRPLALTTSKLRPSGVTRTEVGNQPVGMNPSGRAAPRTPISNTATLLL